MSFFCYIYFFILPQLQKDRHFWTQLDSTDITQDFNDSYVRLDITCNITDSKIILASTAGPKMSLVIQASGGIHERFKDCWVIFPIKDP